MTHLTSHSCMTQNNVLSIAIWKRECIDCKSTTPTFSPNNSQTQFIVKLIQFLNRFIFGLSVTILPACHLQQHIDFTPRYHRHRARQFGDANAFFSSKINPPPIELPVTIHSNIGFAACGPSLHNLSSRITDYVRKQSWGHSAKRICICKYVNELRSK